MFSVSVRLLLPLLIAAVLGANSVCAAEQEVLDGIAAVVNGDVITFSQVREVVGVREKALRDTYKGPELIEKIKELRLQAINDLIDRQLILQEFKKNKFTIPEYVVDDRIQTIIREEFGGDRAAFVRTLEAQGYTLARFKTVEQDKIIVQAMRGRAVKSDAVIPPNKVEEYYQKHRDEFGSQEQVKLRMIVLKKEVNESGAKKKMAEEIRQKVAAEGADFEKLAQMYSEDSTQESGGDWGWIDRKTLNEELTREAFKLKTGQVSEVLEVAGNYYILYVEARKNATVKSLPEVREEIEKKIAQIERQEAQRKWLAGLRSKAYIKLY
jgi:peptidyl-prolyl cis-trans isomerase SurA